MAAYEFELEKCKRNLVGQKDFRLSKLYKIFDENDSGEIIFEEIEDSYRQLGIKPDVEDLILLCKRYNRDQNNRIEY